MYRLFTGLSNWERGTSIMTTKFYPNFLLRRLSNEPFASKAIPNTPTTEDGLGTDLAI